RQPWDRAATHHRDMEQRRHSPGDCGRSGYRAPSLVRRTRAAGNGGGDDPALRLRSTGTASALPSRTSRAPRLAAAAPFPRSPGTPAPVTPRDAEALIATRATPPADAVFAALRKVVPRRPSRRFV